MRIKTAILIGLSGFMLLALLGAHESTSAQLRRQVWVFYLSFWTQDAWDATSDVLSDYPITRYSSSEPSAAARHIQQAKNAGVDAFIVNWFGVEDNQTSLVINTMLNQASANNFKIGVAVDAFPAGVNRSKTGLINSLDWLIKNRTTHPAYLRFDNKPVIYFAFQERTGFSNADWQDIRDQVDPDRRTIWVSEGLNGCCIHRGVFDGMYAFNLAWGNPASTATAQFNAMRNAGGYFYTPTVHPGWDETLVARRDGRSNPTSPRDRAGGQFLINSWLGAVNSEASIILIVSWNEYMENSHIEPSVNYGTQSLDILRPLIRDWKAGRAPQNVTVAQPTAANSDNNNNAGNNTTNSAIVPLGVGSNITVNVESANVRAEPNSSSALVASIFQGESYEAIGETNGWYLIRINRLEGYVYGELVTLNRR